MKRLVAIVVAGSLCLATPVGAHEADQLKTETADLYRVIMAAEAAPDRCQFGTDWLDELVPEYVANKFLGLTLHADLKPPPQITSFQDILDPQRKSATAFCATNETTAYEKAQFDAFESDKTAKAVSVKFAAFALPVFDANYRTAIVIMNRSGLEADRLEISIGRLKPGDIIRHPGYGADFANVYIKRKRDGSSLPAS